MRNAIVNLYEGTFYAGTAPGVTPAQYMEWDGTNLEIRGAVLLPDGSPLPIAEEFPFLGQTNTSFFAENPSYSGLMMTANVVGFADSRSGANLSHE